MLTTLTCNPSFDRTVEVDLLTRGEVHRLARDTIEGGGKGINVAKALVRGGVAARAVFPANASDGLRMRALVEADGGPPCVIVEIDQPIRTNVTIIDGETTTKLNAAGPTLGEHDLDALLAATVDGLTAGEWVAMAGSFPPGVDASFVQRVNDAVSSCGALLALDTSGPALEAAIEARVALIKPNAHELAAVTGTPVDTLGDVVDAAMQLIGEGLSAVAASMGSAGAILATADGVWHACAAAEDVRNTVGAGDAFLSGVLSAGMIGPDALAEGVAWGRAAVASPTTSFPPADAADRAAVVVTADLDRGLGVD